MKSMPFSYDRAWQDLVAMLRANAGLMLTVAGALIFLPDFMRSLLIPGPEIKGFDLAALQQLNGYFASYWLPLLLASLVMRWGEATILVLLLDPRRPTVGDALQQGGLLLPWYFVLNFLVTLIALAGFLALIVPGVYLVGRLAAAAPALIAERVTNPIVALQRSFALTEGKGWLVAGLVFLVAVVVAIALGAAGSVVTVLTSFILPEAGQKVSAAFVDGIMSALSALVMLLLSSAIYRQLTAR